MLAEPRRAEVEAYYQLLRKEGVEQIGGFRLSVLAEVAAGSPSHEPTRFSDTEVRLAWHLIVLRGEQVETDRALARWRRARELGGLGALGPVDDDPTDEEPARITTEPTPVVGTERVAGFWDGHDSEGNPIGGAGVWDQPSHGPRPPEAARMRALRVANRISLRQAANLLGLTVVEVGELERGKRQPCGETTWADIHAVMERT